MGHEIDRRRFLAGTAGVLLASVHSGPAWPAERLVQEAAGAGARPIGKHRRTPGPHGAPWVPSGELVEGLPRLLELGAVPGLALGVVDDGRMKAQGFGRASVERGTPVHEDTLFEAASLGKPIFAYAVLRLADAGEFDLDKPLYDYFPDPEANNRRMRRVTARHVLSHTTGLPNWRQTPGPLEPATEPGKTFSYSGEGFFFLQRVIEFRTGVPFARWIREQVLDPCGMRQSSYVWRPDFEKRMATGYDETGQGLEVYAAIGRKAAGLADQWRKPLEEWRYEDAARAVPLIAPQWPALPVFMIPNAAASLLTTVGDYARFLARVVAQPPAPELALAPATRAAMATPQVKLNSALDWGLGWGLQHDEHGRFLWHWGADMTFRNFTMADPATGRAVVVLTNSLNGPKVYQRVIEAVTGTDQPALLWPYT